MKKYKLHFGKTHISDFYFRRYPNFIVLQIKSWVLDWSGYFNAGSYYLEIEKVG